MPINPTSVVDFLKKRGFQPGTNEQFPLFDFRKDIYSRAGLTPEKGDEFRGTPTENMNLLNLLSSAEQKRGISINPNNINDFISSSRAAGTMAPNGSVIAPEPGSAPSATGLVGSAYSQPNQLTPEQIASQAYDEVTGSMTFPFQKEAVEAEKSSLALNAQAEKEKLINNLASRGLIFSGKKTTGLESIDADLVARTLGVDRKFALLIASGLESSAQKIAKEAQAGNQDALTSLRALGYDINPITGTIEQTLAARNADATAQRAEKSAAIAERRLQLAEESAARTAADVKSTFSSTQINTGASNAGKTISDFKKLDPDTQNFYINNGDKVDKIKKQISDDFSAGVAPSEIESAVVGALELANVPPDAKLNILNHLSKTLPLDKTGNKAIPWYNPASWFQ